MNQNEYEITIKDLYVINIRSAIFDVRCSNTREIQ